MTARQPLSPVIPSALLLAVAVGVTVGLLSWLGGCESLHAYGGALVFLGLLMAGCSILAVGSSLLSARRGLMRHFDTQYFDSLRADGLLQRELKLLQEAEFNKRFVSQVLLAGALLLIVGLLLQVICG